MGSTKTTTRTKRTFFVFYGTQTALVHADDEDEAYDVFVTLLDPVHVRRTMRANYYGESDPPQFGRLVPPGRDEVHIRPPRDSDRGWIEDSGDRQWITAIPETEVSS